MAEKNSLRDLFGKGKDLLEKGKDKAFGAVDRAADSVSEKYDSYQNRKKYETGSLDQKDMFGDMPFSGYNPPLETPYIDDLHSGRSFSSGGGAPTPDDYGNPLYADQGGVFARARAAAQQAYQATLEAAGRGLDKADRALGYPVMPNWAQMPDIDMPDFGMPDMPNLPHIDPRALYNRGRSAVGLPGTVSNPDYRLSTPNPRDYPFQGGAYMPGPARDPAGTRYETEEY